MDYTPNDWATPDWANAGRVHEWKNYFSEEVQTMWGNFTDAQKQALARQAESNASNEEWD
jgi:hypothetical protein